MKLKLLLPYGPATMLICNLLCLECEKLPEKVLTLTHQEQQFRGSQKGSMDEGDHEAELQPYRGHSLTTKKWKTSPMVSMVYTEERNEDSSRDQKYGKVLTTYLLLDSRRSELEAFTITLKDLPAIDLITCCPASSSCKEQHGSLLSRGSRGSIST
jgi:hypothetical protein